MTTFNQERPSTGDLKDPFFSIVIANYNHGRFLEEAILSVLTQSCQDFELIVVDGGSTDNSVEIIKKYEHRIAWWCSEKDRGQSHAFNKGFSRARGKFFTWLNADDLLLPNTLARVRDCLEKNRTCRWVVGNTIFFSKDGKILWCSQGPSWIKIFSKKMPPYVHGPTSFFSRDIFAMASGFDENLRYAMDVDLWGKFAKLNIPFLRLKHYFWGFRIHEFSRTSHAFDNDPEFAFLKERALLSDRYQWNNAFFYEKLLFVVKVLSGSYLWAWIDTWRFKGKHITEVFKYL